MNTLEELLGVDARDPEYLLARMLARGDREFLAELVRARKKQGLTQTQVADRLGISQAAVAAFERHDNDPKLSTIRRYAQVVGALVVHRVATMQWKPSGLTASFATVGESRPAQRPVLSDNVQREFALAS